MFNIVLRIFGFLIGAAIGGGLGVGFTQGNAIAGIFAGLLGGALLSAIIVTLRNLGIFLFGASLGLLLGSLLALAGLNHILVFVMLAIAGGVLAVVMDKIDDHSFDGDWRRVACRIWHRQPLHREREFPVKSCVWFSDERDERVADCACSRMDGVKYRGDSRSIRKNSAATICHGSFAY